MLTLQITILKQDKHILNSYLYLIWSSSSLLPILKSHTLCSFSTINFKYPLDPFKIQFLFTINDVFVGPVILDMPRRLVQILNHFIGIHPSIKVYGLLLYFPIIQEVVQILNVSNNQSYNLTFFIYSNTQRQHVIIVLEIPKYKNNLQHIIDCKHIQMGEVLLWHHTTSRTTTLNYVALIYERSFII